MRTYLATAMTAIFLGLPLTGHALLAEDLTAPLTAGQVSCNESQLARLLTRIKTSSVTIPLDETGKAFTTLVSYSNSSGFYEGISLTSEEARTSSGLAPVPTPESYLAWNLNPSIRMYLLNPARQPLGQVELTREETSSNLVPPHSAAEILLTLDPTLAETGGPGLLTINNFMVPLSGAPYNGFVAASTAPGRGLSADDLLTNCHTLLTAQNRKVFALLERMVRVQAVMGPSFLDAKVTIFRGGDPHLYRMDVSLSDLFDRPQGKVAVSLQVNWTSTGALTTGTLSMLPACAPNGDTGCSAPAVGTSVILIPPVFGGIQKWGGDPRIRGVGFDLVSGPSAPASIDFAALLRDTTWND